MGDFIKLHNAFKEPVLIRRSHVISVRRFKGTKTLIKTGAPFDEEVQESIEEVEALLNG